MLRTSSAFVFDQQTKSICTYKCNLETVEKWQLFGAAFFFVKRTVTKRNEHLDCVLSINKGGIRVLANKTHEILSEYPLEEVFEFSSFYNKRSSFQIASTNKYSLSERQFFEIHLTNLASQKYGYDVITIETDLVCFHLSFI